MWLRLKMNNLSLCCFLFACVLSSGCGQMRSALQIPGFSDSSSNTETPPSIDGAKLYTNNCATCHGALESSVKIGRSAAQITDALNSQPAMAHLRFLTAAEVSAISGALQPGAISQNKISDYKNTIATRSYLRSAYQQAFVDPAINAADIEAINKKIDELITYQGPALGGTTNICDLERGFDSPYSASSARMIPPMNALRKSLLTRACEEILDYDSAVAVALNHAGGLSTNSPGDDANMTALYEFFHIGRNPNQASLNSLKSIYQQAMSSGLGSTDAWRFVVYTLCIGGGLETL